jgi:hypothetical protein
LARLLFGPNGIGIKTAFLVLLVMVLYKKKLDDAIENYVTTDHQIRSLPCRQH